MSKSLQPHGLQMQAPVSSNISQSLLNFMSIESVMLYEHLILWHPLLLLPSIFPKVRVFSTALQIKWPKYFGSFSFSPPNVGLISFRTDWFDLLESKGLSSVFSSSTVFKSISSSALSLLYGPTLTAIHDHWKNQSFDYTDLCQVNTYYIFKFFAHYFKVGFLVFLLFIFIEHYIFEFKFFTRHILCKYFLQSMACLSIFLTMIFED